MIVTRRKLLLAGASSLIVSPAVARFPRGSAPAAISGLKIALTFDTSPAWTTSPSYYQTGLTTAVNMIEAAFPNTNITFNLEVGYTQIQNGTPGSIGSGVSAGNEIGGSFINYTTIKSALAAIPSPTASLSSMLANLPGGTSVGGSSSFFVPTGTQKMLGLLSPNAAPLDGAIGIGTGWGSNKVVGVFLHEITHAMGRIVGYGPFVLSRFSAPGTWRTSSSAVTSYFSLDGGTTPLANYDTTQDGGDFLDNSIQDTGGFQDCFDAHQNTNPIQNLSTIDLQLMNAMGFQ